MHLTKNIKWKHQKSIRAKQSEYSYQLNPFIHKDWCFLSSLSNLKELSCTRQMLGQETLCLDIMRSKICTIWANASELFSSQNWARSGWKLYVAIFSSAKISSSSMLYIRFRNLIKILKHPKESWIIPRSSKILAPSFWKNIQLTTYYLPISLSYQVAFKKMKMNL